MLKTKEERSFMVSAQLAGGLGNQLFQIAAAYSLAINNNSYAEFEFNKHYSLGQGDSPNQYKSSIFCNIPSTDNAKKEYIFHETKVKDLFYVPNIHLVGFFQSEEYFAKNRAELLKLLNIKPKNYSNMCSVHVRRGDIKPYLELQYYKQAMSLFKGFNFLVFSDDLLWCQQNLAASNVTFVSSGLADQSLLLMSQCENNIISNSTFSWWASYINSNKNKIVVAPLSLPPNLHTAQMVFI